MFVGGISLNKEYDKLEIEYKQLKKEYIYLRENGGDKKSVKEVGTKLFKLALTQISIMQNIELEEL